MALYLTRCPGYCSHMVGLMFTLDLWKGQNVQDLPEPLTCTGLPQQWSRPRGPQIYPAPIHSVVIAKAKPHRKRKPVTPKVTDCRYWNS